MKHVILNSGGIDSLALAIKYQTDELHSLHFHLGAPSSDAQAEAARLIADKYCVSHEVIELHGLLLGQATDGRVKSISYQTPCLAILGSSYAFKQGIVSVLSGNKYEYVNKDFEKFYLKMMQTVRKDERVYSRPLGGLTFEDVYQIVREDKLLPETVSCLSLPRCGICPKCKKRQQYNIDPA